MSPPNGKRKPLPLLPRGESHVFSLTSLPGIIKDEMFHRKNDDEDEGENSYEENNGTEAAQGAGIADAAEDEKHHDHSHGSNFVDDEHEKRGHHDDPKGMEIEVEQSTQKAEDIIHRINSFRRNVYLFLSEPQSSVFSAVFFAILMVMILVSNILMIGQTTKGWTYTPETCEFCFSSPEAFIDPDVPCVCEPEPLPVTVTLQDICMYFFAIEWILRVTCYVPPPPEYARTGYMAYLIAIKGWSKFLCQPSTVVDALAVFPYFLEKFLKIEGLLALRLLRIFRLFLLLRLGAFSSFFKVLINVMVKSLISFYILLMGLVFGAAFFGSMIYFFEKGKWQYTTYTDPPSYRYMRLSVDGINYEPSPFKSIPASFWWFIVTATTVGYGDYYPTSPAGKCVASLAMIAGLIVVAFPVSIFCELWSKELKNMNAENEKDEEKKEETENESDISTSSQNEQHGLSSFPQDVTSKSNREDKAFQGSDDINIKPVADNEVHSGKYTQSALNFGLYDQSLHSQSDDFPGILLSQPDVDSLCHHLALIDIHQKEIQESQNQVRRIIRNATTANYNNESSNTMTDPVVALPINEYTNTSESKSELQ